VTAAEAPAGPEGSVVLVSNTGSIVAAVGSWQYIARGSITAVSP
jgi:hypothetical protein